MRLNTLAIVSASLFVLLGVSACGKGGHAQETKGHLESAAGALTGDDKLKREGKKDEVIGGVKGAVGDLKDAAHDATK